MVEVFQSDGIDWDDDEVVDDYYDLVDVVVDYGVFIVGEWYGLGGYLYNVQGDMWLEVELVSYGFYCGNQIGYQDLCCVVLEVGGVEWSLLLQFDFDDYVMWGDFGMLYGWICQSDLVVWDLLCIWMCLQFC